MNPKKKITGKYYVIYNPLTFTLMDQLGKCSSPLDLVSILTGKDASRLNEKNYLDFLSFNLDRQRVGLVEMLGMENYALPYLGNQLLKHDPDAAIILADGKRRTLRGIIEEKGHLPKAVLISAMSSNFPAAAAAAMVLNHAEIPVIIGGIHSSCAPGDIDRYIRNCVPHRELVSVGRGPGDSRLMKELVTDLDNGALKPQYVGHESIEDGMWGHESIAHMEPMRIAMLKKMFLVGGWISKYYNINGILPYAGCPYRCSFCSITSMPEGAKKFKSRSPEDFVSELKHNQRNGVNNRNRIYYFLSDNLLFGGKILDEILDKIIDSKLVINFAAQMPLEIADRGDLLDKLRRAGAIQFILGLESLDIRNLEAINKKSVSDIKRSGKSVKDYYAMQVRKIQDRGITVVGAFIFGLPYDYFHSHEDNSAVDAIAFCKENHMGMQSNPLTDLPGSPNFNERMTRGNFLYGEPGTMDYLLSLSVADLSEGNRPAPDSLENSPLLPIYMAYESSRQTGAHFNTLRNGFKMAWKAWKRPTGNGRKRLHTRIYETFLAFANQWSNSLYRETYRAVASPGKEYEGAFERLYESEENPQVREVFADYVQKFRCKKSVRLKLPGFDFRDFLHYNEDSIKLHGNKVKHERI